MRKLRKLLAVASTAAAMSAMGVAPAAAHTQTVTPPGQEPVVSGPISKAYAQAHCNAQAPAVTGTASGGVVVFSPQGALPCPAVANPGGQIHPHAG